MTTTRHASAQPVPARATVLYVASARVALAGAFAFTAVEALAFVRAFADLNVNPPARTAVLSWLANAIVAALATSALTVWAVRPRAREWALLASAALVGFVAGMLLAQRLMPSLGPDGHREWLAWASLLLLVALPGLGVWIGTELGHREEIGRRVVSSAIVAHCFVYVALALAMLANLPELEEEARRVSPTPPLGLVWVLAGLLAALTLLRRRLT